MAFLLSCFLLDQVQGHDNASFLGSCKEKNFEAFRLAYKGIRPNHMNDGKHKACETNFVSDGKAIALICALTQAKTTGVGVYSGVPGYDYIFKCLPCKDEALMKKHKILSKYDKFMANEDNCLDHGTVVEGLNTLYHAASGGEQPRLRANHGELAAENLQSIYISGTGEDGMNASLAEKAADRAFLQASSSLQKPVNDKATVALSNSEAGVKTTMTLEFRTLSASEFRVTMTGFQVAEDTMVLEDFTMNEVSSGDEKTLVLTIKPKIKKEMVGEIVVKIANVVNPRAVGKTAPFGLTVTEGRNTRELIAPGVSIEAPRLHSAEVDSSSNAAGGVTHATFLFKTEYPVKRDDVLTIHTPEDYDVAQSSVEESLDWEVRRKGKSDITLVYKGTTSTADKYSIGVDNIVNPKTPGPLSGSFQLELETEAGEKIGDTTCSSTFSTIEATETISVTFQVPRSATNEVIRATLPKATIQNSITASSTAGEVGFHMDHGTSILGITHDASSISSLKEVGSHRFLSS